MITDEQRAEWRRLAEAAPEKLADYAHRAWSGWMRYMFAKGLIEPDTGVFRLPTYYVERWKRQSNTAYVDLPEEEKPSDRKEVQEILSIAPLEALPALLDENDDLRRQLEAANEQNAVAVSELDKRDVEMAELRRELEQAQGLLRELYDDDPCQYDHHGYCQAHGLSEKPCVMERVRAFLAQGGQA